MRTGHRVLRALYVYQILAEADTKMNRKEIHGKLRREYGINDNLKTVGALLNKLVDAELINGDGFVERVINHKSCDDEVDNSFYSKYYVERQFSDDELLWLIDNTIFSKQLPLSKSKSLVKKLLKLGGRNLGEKVGSVEGMRQFYHTPNEEVSKNIEALSAAIHKNKAVGFFLAEYQLNKSLKVIEDELVVKPVRMVPYNGFYYLIAFNPNVDTLQHYRIDKIKELKTVDKFIDYDVINSKLFIDEYLASHSLMQSGNAAPAWIKVPETQIGLVIDQFGDKFRVLENVDGMATVSLSSNENDLYLWALEHGDLVEVLEPQSIRNKIRLTVSQMHQKYSCAELDRYDIELARAQKPLGYTSAYEFICPNVELDSKHEWKRLTQLTSLRFKNNNITDFSFVKTLVNLRCVTFEKDQVNDLTFLLRLPKLTSVWLTETNVSDISCLADLPLKYLKLVRNEELTDYSALLKMKSLGLLYIDSETAKKIDIPALKQSNPKLEIVVHSKQNGDVRV